MVFEKREQSDDDIYLAIINNNGALTFLELNSNYCAPVKSKGLSKKCVDYFAHPVYSRSYKVLKI